MVTRSSFGSGAPSWSLLLGLFACAVDPSGLAPIAQGDGGQGDATPGDATPVDVGPFDADTPDGPVPPDAGEDADIPDDVGVDARVPCEGELVRCGPLGVERCDEGLFELSEPCDLGCVPGTTPRCVRFVPSNVNRELLPEPGGAPVEVDGGSFDTTSCSGGMIVHQADGAPQLCVVSYDGDLTLRGEVRVRGTRPLVVLVAGTFEVAAGAVLDLRAEGTSGGPGGGGAEGGLFAGSRGSESGWYDDGGGGGGGACGPGGAGGRGAGAAGGAAGAAHADTYMLSPLFAGSGGGRAARAPGNAGGGGGALQVSARGAIVVRGTIDAAGAGGRGGDSPTVGNRGSGGGGGSGGSVLLESPIAVRIEGGTLWAGGGGGGSGATSSDGNHGRAGNVDPPTGGPSPGSQGGRGGDGGRDGMGEPGGSTSSNNGNGGGGGGGAGCVVLRTPGAAPGTPAGLGVVRSGEPIVE